MKKKLFTFLMTLILLTGSGTWLRHRQKAHTLSVWATTSSGWMTNLSKSSPARFTRHVSRQNTGNNGYK